MNDDDYVNPNLGPCCVCESEDGVNAVVLLSLKNEVPGHGWGCVVCDLPADGAYPRQVRSGAMRQSVADYHMARIKAALATLKWVREHEGEIKKAVVK